MGAEEPRAERDIFDDLAVLCAAPGFVHALSWMSLRDNYVMFDSAMDSKALADSYVSERIIRTEFSTLLGLLIRQPIDLSDPTPAEIRTLLDRAHTLLQELHKQLERPMWDLLIERAKFSKEGAVCLPFPFARADILREPIFYGGESAYSFQYCDMALERYAADEVWLRTNKGFSIADAQAVVHAITDIHNVKIPEVLRGFKGAASPCSSLLPAFAVTAEEVAAHCRQPIETTRAVLTAFSVTAPSNLDFTSLGAFNLANACPIIALPDERYLALQTYGIDESLYDSPFYWMIADRSYRADASAHRGAFTEQFVAKRFRSVFGERNVYCNVNIEGKSDRVSEIDVMVLFGDRAVIVQCKSKKMTLESRNGNDKTLRDDFQKAVQDAYDQGLICARALGNPDMVFMAEDGSKLDIPELRHVYIVCAVSDHYPGLTVQARQFLKYETDAVIHPPLVADLFLIDVMTEMLASPLRLLSYIDRRVGYAERIYSINELAILGFHLSQNLWFEDEIDTAIVGDECALDLDTAMAVRRQGISGVATPNGILTKFSGTHVAQMIDKIEREAHPDLIGLGFLLLDMNEDTVAQLDRGMKDIARRTRGDGRRHDFTLVFSTGEAGLTILCNPAQGSDAVKALDDHCRRRKYVHRAANWFGLLVSETDGLPELSLVVRFPWKHDPKMDVETQGMMISGTLGAALPRTNNRAPDGTKIGRNAPCPCESGKKFKKCCLV
ncbi:preprotein translocase [Gluconobacter japonicus]|nr:preprotein translocase [Gluconobacter japonicus]KXV41877.1 preprotein translocase [Gluconobacter japonicus]